MDEKQLQALANELAKNLKTPEDLSQFDRLLKKLSVEAALNAEMTHHPGYEKNQSRPGANSRNGYSTKTVITGVRRKCTSRRFSASSLTDSLRSVVRLRRAESACSKTAIRLSTESGDKAGKNM